MEAGLKLRLFAVAVMAVVAASSLVEKAVASDAPSPGPSSGAAATLAAPAAVLASLSALVVGYFVVGHGQAPCKGGWLQPRPPCKGATASRGGGADRKGQPPPA
ncbi:hypothetical protein GW17_00056632 [Ensete ventricosum]|nr:hypothetical protein GW17_00056632 [Ensete ventricosum]